MKILIIIYMLQYIPQVTIIGIIIFIVITRSKLLLPIIIYILHRVFLAVAAKRSFKFEISINSFYRLIILSTTFITQSRLFKETPIRFFVNWIMHYASTFENIGNYREI